MPIPGSKGDQREQNALAVAKDPDALSEPLGSFVRFAIVYGRKKGKTVSLNSGRRTEAMQIELRRAHCGTSQFDIYEKASGQCNPPTARPGMSKHQSGEAADMTGSKEWMAQVLRPYGVTRPVSGEDWHFEYKGSDAPSDLRKLAEFMDSQGFTDAEFVEVFGPGGGEDRGGGVVSLTTRAGGFLINLGKGIPIIGGFIDTAEQAYDTATSTYQMVARLSDSLNEIASFFTNPQGWLRIGKGTAGLALVLTGGWLVIGSTVSEALPEELVGSIVKKAKTKPSTGEGS